MTEPPGTYSRKILRWSSSIDDADIKDQDTAKDAKKAKTHSDIERYSHDADLSTVQFRAQVHSVSDGRLFFDPH